MLPFWQIIFSQYPFLSPNKHARDYESEPALHDHTACAVLTKGMAGRKAGSGSRPGLRQHKPESIIVIFLNLFVSVGRRCALSLRLRSSTFAINGFPPSRTRTAPGRDYKWVLQFSCSEKCTDMQSSLQFDVSIDPNDWASSQAWSMASSLVGSSWALRGCRDSIHGSIHISITTRGQQGEHIFL